MCILLSDDFMCLELQNTLIVGTYVYLWHHVEVAPPSTMLSLDWCRLAVGISVGLQLVVFAAGGLRTPRMASIKDVMAATTAL
jgi:hypothetical protein